MHSSIVTQATWLKKATKLKNKNKKTKSTHLIASLIKIFLNLIWQCHKSGKIYAMIILSIYKLWILVFADYIPWLLN